MPHRIWKFVAKLLTLLSLTASLGCATAEKEESCSNAECYGVCLGNAWTDLKESYWKFEAFCVDGDMCNCFSSCDPERCNDYCVDEMSRTGGDCDFLDCVCTGPIQDAGPDASE